MEPDLSHSITMHPHVFQTQSQSNSSFHSPRVLSPAQSSQPGMGATSSPSNNNAERSGSSTAVEAAAPSDDVAFARHAPAPPPGATEREVEGQMAGDLPLGGVEQDPYGLSRGYKSATEIEEIKANTSRKRFARQPSVEGSTTGSGLGSASGSNGNGEAGRNFGLGGGAKGNIAACIPAFGRAGFQARQVQDFYQSQNETIQRLLKSVEEHRADARHEQGEDQVRYRIAVWGSFVANVLLAGLQLYGAISSGSLSLFTTMADAIFDPLSNITLIITNRAVRTVDPSRFPSGKARLETVGNIVFCFLMTAVSFILIAFSVRDLADGFGHGSNVVSRGNGLYSCLGSFSDLGSGVFACLGGVPDQAGETNPFHLPSVIAVACAFATKLVLFLYTWSIKDKYSQVHILWQDHRNDLLINGFGILTSVGGSKLKWWVDPMGAIILSIIVSVIWLRTAFAEFLLLVGVVASVEMQQLITYVCVTHSPAIRQIDTVRVYHAGPRLIAEVDVVMDPAATLMETHDVAEELQFKLESLPDVERAYVHVDYETTHKPEHAYKKDL